MHAPKVDGSRASVAVALSQADKPARTYQFDLRKTGGGWRIEHDGLYDRALKALCAPQRRGQRLTAAPQRARSRQAISTGSARASARTARRGPSCTDP